MIRSGRTAALVFGLTGAASIGLSWVVAQHSLIGARWTFVFLFASWIPLWVAGVWAANRIPSAKWGLVAVVVVAGALRVAAVTGTTPSVSNDVYRYGWDARVQLSGTDPYRYPPAAPQLVKLRTPTYFPGAAECARLRIAPGPSCTTINRPEVRTIYPPAAEAWFDVVSLVDPSNGTRKWKIAGALVDLAAIGLLVRGLRDLKRDPREVAWYALSPLPVLEFAGNGHVDGLGLLLLIAAFLALRRGRRVAAGVLIGLATMVKLYPGIAVIGAWRKGRWRMVRAAAAVSLTAYLPHVVAVGTKIVGYLPGYFEEEHYGSGGRFLILSLLPIRGHMLAVLSAAVVALVAAAVVRSRVDPVTATATIFLVALLVASPVQPWYAVVLAGLGIVVRAPWLALPALLAEPYYAAVVLDNPHQIRIGQLCYLVAATSMLALILRERGVQRVRIGAMSSTRL